MQGEIKALAYCSQSNILASGGDNKVIDLWNLETNTHEQIITDHSKSIRSLACSYGGQLLASASLDGNAEIWNLETKQQKHKLTAHTDSLYGISFSSDDAILATSGANGIIRLWSAETGEPHGKPLKGHKGVVFSSRFIENDKRLVSAGEDKDLRIWDIESGKTLLFLQEHTSSVTGVTVHEDTIFSVSNDMSAKQWTSKLPYQIHEMPNIPTAAAIAAAPKQLAVGYKNGLLQLFSLSDMTTPIAEITAHQGDIQRLTFSQNEQWLASAGWNKDKQVKLWKLEQQQLIEQTISLQHQKGIHSIAFSPDNQFLVSGGMDGKIGIVDLKNQKLTYHVIDEKDFIVSVDFDNTGKLLTSTGNRVNLWNFNELRTSTTLPKPLHTSTSLPETRWATLSNSWDIWNTSQQKQHYVTTGRTSTVHIFEIDANKPDTAQLKYQLTGHVKTVWKAIFSPDNQQLATAGADDGTIRFWDLLNGSGPFTLHLPIDFKEALYDFDFKCNVEGYCWVAVPLMNGKLIIYDLGEIY